MFLAWLGVHNIYQKHLANVCNRVPRLVITRGRKHGTTDNRAIYHVIWQFEAETQG